MNLFVYIRVQVTTVFTERQRKRVKQARKWRFSLKPLYSLAYM